MARRAQKLWSFIMLSPGLGLLFLFVLLPVILTAWISLHNWSMYTPITEMDFVGFANYREIFAGRSFRKALGNTLLYSGLNLALILPLALLVGLLLFQGMIRGRKLLRGIVFIPYMIPTIAVAIIWGYLYAPLHGPLNQILGWVGLPAQPWLGSVDTAMISLVIFNIWQTLGYYTILVVAGLTQIPTVYFEAAVIDGANAFQRTLLITLPLLRRTMLFVVVIAIINTAQVFDPVYVLTQGGPANATTVLSYEVYKNAFEFGLAGKASSMAFILFMVLAAAVAAVMKLLHDPAEGSS